MLKYFFFFLTILSFTSINCTLLNDTNLLIDTYMDMAAIVMNKGYKIEQHFAVTEDEYILGVFRIPYSRAEVQDLKDGKEVKDPSTKPAVLLQHGLLDSSFTWVNNFPDQSLAFLLADAGFDVWLGNNRGNTWSRRHMKLTTHSNDFWKFTWDEMAQYDLPALLQCVLDNGKHETVSYVGHSEGTTQAFAGFTLEKNKEIAEKVNLFVALAPVAYCNNAIAPINNILQNMDPTAFFEEYGIAQFMPGNMITRFAPYLCDKTPDLCAVTLSLLVGPSSLLTLNATRLEVYTAETPAGTSSLNMARWNETFYSEQFQMHDYGSPEENYEHYGQDTPPIYDLGNIYAKNIALFSGKFDFMADPTDVERLVSELPAENIAYQEQVAFNHLDFVWSPNPEVVNEKVVDLLKEYS